MLILWYLREINSNGLLEKHNTLWEENKEKIAMRPGNKTLQCNFSVVPGDKNRYIFISPHQTSEPNSSPQQLFNNSNRWIRFVIKFLYSKNFFNCSGNNKRNKNMMCSSKISRSWTYILRQWIPIMNHIQNYLNKFWRTFGRRMWHLHKDTPITLKSIPRNSTSKFWLCHIGQA